MKQEKNKSSLLEYAVKELKHENIKLKDQIENITKIEIKKREELLKLQSAALEATVNGVVITDVNGIITWVNSAFCKFTGYKIEEVVNKSTNILKSGFQDDDFYKELWETILAGHSWVGELTNKKKDGTLYFEEMSITPVRDENGKISHFISVKQNITERKTDQRNLLINQQSVDQSALGIIWVNADSKIIYANKTILKNWNYSQEEASSLTISDVDPNWHDKKYFDEQFDILRKNNSLKFESINKRKDESLFPVEVSLKLLTYANEEIIVAYISDISVQSAFREIENLVITAKNLDDLLGGMHRSISKVIPAPNCYVALFDDVTKVVSFPYFVDQFDAPPQPGILRNGSTEYVIKTGKPVRLTREKYQELIDKKIIDASGTLPYSWIGVPLYQRGKSSGVLVLQSYDENLEYTEEDINWLSSITNLVATAIERKNTEKRLIQNHKAVENSALGIIWTDEKKNIIFVNKWVTETLQYSENELLNMNLSSFLTSSSLPADKSDEQNKDNLNLTFTYESIFKRKNGSTFPAEITSTTLEMDGEQLTISYVHDISNRKKAENELVDSHYKFRELIKNSTLGIIRLDEDGEIIMVNPAFIKMLDYNSEIEVIKQDTKAIYSSLNNRNRFIQTLKRKERISGFEDSLLKKDGSVIEIRESAWAVKDKYDKVLYFEVIVEDITEQNQVLKILHESEFKYRMLIDKLNEAVYLLVDGKFEIVNSKFLELFEITEEELYSPDFNLFDYMPSNEKANINNRHNKAIEGKEVATTYEMTVTTKTDIEKEVEVSVSYLNFNGKVAAQGVVRDLTDIKKQETQIRHLQKMESIGTLAAGIAHEINTPSQFVNDNLSFLKDAYKDLLPILNTFKDIDNIDSNSAELKQAIESADLDYLKEEIPIAIDQSLDGVQRIASIVGAMRDFAHNGPKDKVSVNIHKIIKNSITLSKNTWKYIAEIETDFDDNLQTIVCQPNDINQVIVNMIVNSSHAMESKFGSSDTIQGKINIKTINREDKIEIVVNDNGSGMPEKVIKRIFDPFYTTKEVGKGTGQGLAIAYDIIVTKHGGEIEVVSQEGEGTTFTIKLPVDQPTEF